MSNTNKPRFVVSPGFSSMLSLYTEILGKNNPGPAAVPEMITVDCTILNSHSKLLLAVTLGSQDIANKRVAWVIGSSKQWGEFLVWFGDSSAGSDDSMPDAEKCKSSNYLRAGSSIDAAVEYIFNGKVPEYHMPAGNLSNIAGDPH